MTEANRETDRRFFSVLFSDFYLFDTLFGLEAYDLADKAWYDPTDRIIKLEDGKIIGDSMYFERATGT